jgi:hypothetical protein
MGRGVSQVVELPGERERERELPGEREREREREKTGPALSAVQYCSVPPSGAVGPVSLFTWDGDSPRKL